MVEMIRQIAASSDDCFVFDATMRLTIDSIFIAVHGFFSSSYMRFLNIPIPPNSTIVHAHLELCSDGWQAGTTELLVHGIREPNPATFSTAIDAEARPVTATLVPWNMDLRPGYFSGNWDLDTWHGWPDGPELKDIVQEIVAQAGWVSGNSLAIKIEASDVGISRSVYSWDGDPAKAPILVIAFTPPGVQHTLAISATIGGTTNPAPGSYLYDEGIPVDVLAIPDAGYRFLNWDLDGLVIVDNPITVVIDADRTLVAMFELVLPSKVSGLSATNITEDSFNVAWNPSPPEEETTLYRVYLRKI